MSSCDGFRQLAIAASGVEHADAFAAHGAVDRRKGQVEALPARRREQEETPFYGRSEATADRSPSGFAVIHAIDSNLYSAAGQCVFWLLLRPSRRGAVRLRRSRW